MKEVRDHNRLCSTPPDYYPSSEDYILAGALGEQVRTELAARGCRAFAVSVLPSVILPGVFLVRVQNLINRMTLEITGEEMDKVMGQLPPVAYTGMVMDLVAEQDSAVCC